MLTDSFIVKDNEKNKTSVINWQREIRSGQLILIFKIGCIFLNAPS